MCENEDERNEGPVQEGNDSLGEKIACVISEVGEHVEGKIDKALEMKRKSVFIKMSDDLISAADKLVESGLFESRSDAALFLMNSGLRSEEALFEKIEDRIGKIQRIRDEMREMMGKDILKKAGIDPKRTSETVDQKIEEMHRLRDEIRNMVGDKFSVKEPEKESEES
jgi:Arc/MetJ-type ribon-helix-helix transcriptional regulator